MKAFPGQSGTGLVLYDAWAVPGVITDMCCLLKFTDHYPQPPDLLGLILWDVLERGLMREGVRFV